MDNEQRDIFPNVEREPLYQWSAGYDAGFARIVPADLVVDSTYHGEYVAGFARGLKDRHAIDAELPPRG